MIADINNKYCEKSISQKKARLSISLALRISEGLVHSNFILLYDTCKVLHEFLDYKHKYLFLLRFHFYSVLRNFFLLTYHFTCVFDVLLNLGYAFTIYKEILHTYTIDNFSVNLVLLTILLFTFFYFPLSRNPSNDLSSSFLVSII
jgi:hypothetical protein